MYLFWDIADSLVQLAILLAVVRLGSIIKNK